MVTINSLEQQELKKQQMKKEYLSFHTLYSRIIRSGNLPNSFVIKTLSHMAASIGDTDQIQRIFSDLQKHQFIFTHEYFHSVISGYCIGRHVQPAFKMFYLMEEKPFSIQPELSIYDELFTLTRRLTLEIESLELLDKIEQSNYNLDVSYYNSVMRVLYRKKKYDIILDIYSRMKSKSIIPNDITLNILFKIYQYKDYEVYRVIELLHEFKNEFQLSPDPKLMQELLSYSLNTGDKYTTLEVLDMINKNNNSHAYDIESYNTCIKTHCNNNHIELGFHTYKEMIRSEVSPNFKTYEYLIDLCKFNKSYSRAIDLFGEMKTKPIIPTPKTFSQMIEIYVGVSKLDKALETYNRMILSGIRPNTLTYNYLIRGFCRNKQLERVDEIVKEMLDSGLRPDTQTMNNIIEGYCIKGEINYALFYMEECYKNDKIEPNVATLTLLLQHCKSKQNAKKGKEIFKQMTDKGIEPTYQTYINLIDLCGYDRKPVETARTYFEQIKKLNKVPLTHQIYNSLIRICCKYNDVSYASYLLLEEMPKNNILPRKNMFIHVSRKCKDHELSKKLASKMRSSPF